MSERNRFIGELAVAFYDLDYPNHTRPLDDMDEGTVRRCYARATLALTKVEEWLAQSATERRSDTTGGVEMTTAVDAVEGGRCEPSRQPYSDDPWDDADPGFDDEDFFDSDWDGV